MLSTRLSPRRSLAAFALLEVGIAVFGALSCGLYYDVLSRHGSWLYASPLAGGALHFLSLLPPTLLMGMSLPFLVRALVDDVGRAGRTVGLLYGLNTLGAAAGAFLVLIGFPVWAWFVLAESFVVGNAIVSVLGNE